jgi:hypothetical protein
MQELHQHAYSRSSTMQEPDHASMLAQRTADSALVLSLLALLLQKVQLLRRSRATRSCISTSSIKVKQEPFRK